MLKRLLLSMAVLAASVVSAAADTAKEILDPYVGTWTGQIQVTDSTGNLRQTIKGTHTFTWDKKNNVLRGTHVFEAGGKTNSAESETGIFKGELVRKMIYKDKEPTLLKGVWKDKRLTWIPAAVWEATKYQIIEYVEVKDKKRTLVIQRVELTSERSGVPTGLRYDGRFQPAK